MKRKKRVWMRIGVAFLTLVVAAAGAAGFVGIRWLANAKKARTDPLPEIASGRIHFLNTGSSDAILLESDGHFALVDSGEDSEFPAGKPDLRANGYEQVVLQYLKDHAANGQGKVKLDFVLATHSHSDHIGGFDTILSDPAVEVERAYFKTYHPENIRDYEQENWDNQQVYDQFVRVLEQRGIAMITRLPEAAFSLGNFQLKMLNTQYDTRTGAEIGENDNSIVLHVQSPDGFTALLTGDMENHSGDEDTVAKQVGKVDLLKLGHHGYEGSTTAGFLKTVSPSVTVATNYSVNVYTKVRWPLIFSGIPLFATVEDNGLVASFTSKGIRMTKNAMTRQQMELMIPAQAE